MQGAKKSAAVTYRDRDGEERVGRHVGRVCARVGGCCPEQVRAIASIRRRALGSSTIIIAGRRAQQAGAAAGQRVGGRVRLGSGAAGGGGRALDDGDDAGGGCCTAPRTARVPSAVSRTRRGGRARARGEQSQRGLGRRTNAVSAVVGVARVAGSAARGATGAHDVVRTDAAIVASWQGHGRSYTADSPTHGISF